MGLRDEIGEIVRNDEVGPSLFVMKLVSPRIAADVQPGQFVHARIPHFSSHILRRPFSVYSRDLSSGTIDILYRVVGAGTSCMASLTSGEILDLIGPVGRPWAPPAQTSRALLVGGGVGAAPLYMLCEKLLSDGVATTVVLGAQNAASLICRDRFAAVLGQEPLCATDDGSFGRAGFCTSLVTEALDEARAACAPFDYVATCGPEPLMRAVAFAALEEGAACEVSMERRMACGIGACLSCVVDTQSGKARACVDGPIFDAKEIVW